MLENNQLQDREISMRLILLLILVFSSGISIASDAKILKASAELTSAQKFNISVTVEHADEGWDHYANTWRVYSMDGKLIGERILYHPHVNEQPFTRSLLGLSVPSEVKEVMIVAVCSKTGESKASYNLKLR